MEQRTLGRTGKEVGVVGLGAWQIGSGWGEVSDHNARDVVHAAISSGITFLDTADVYGDGRSERLCSEVLREPGVFVATKMGQSVAQIPENYNQDNFDAWNERSRRNLGVDTIDLVQLHCPPTAVYHNDAVFAALDEMVKDGRIRHYGVSAATCDEALAAIARPNVATVQIIINCFRLKPLEKVLPAAREAGVGIIVRVPLASGLLAGKYDEHTAFAAEDHRTYNREGEVFDIGETFAGVPFDVGLAAVDELRDIVPPDLTMSQFALRWVIDQPGVSVVIPGARTATQVRANAASAQVPSLSADQLLAVTDVYDRLVRPHVHDRW